MLDPIWMNTVSVEVETDALALDVETSLVLDRTDQQPSGNTSKLRRRRKLFWILTEALIRHGGPSPGGGELPQQRDCGQENWRQVALAKSISTAILMPEKKGFGRAAKVLIQKKIVAKWQNLVWKCN